MTDLIGILKPRYVHALYNAGFETVEDLQEAIKRYGLKRYGNLIWWANCNGSPGMRGFGNRGWEVVFEYFDNTGFDYKQYMFKGNLEPLPKTREQYEVIINKRVDELINLLKEYTNIHAAQQVAQRDLLPGG